MKNTIYLFGILILGMSSCKDDNNIEANYVNANLNGLSWEGEPEITLTDRNDTLIFLGIGDEEVLGFKLKFRGQGAYDLAEINSFFYTTYEGDVFTSEYTLDVNSSSQITITAYDSNQNSLNGNFEIKLIKEWSNPENDRDTLIFTDGKFKGIISN